MKKTSNKSKLSISKEAIARLNNEQLNVIQGGNSVLPPFTITMSCTVCTTGDGPRTKTILMA